MTLRPRTLILLGAALVASAGLLAAQSSGAALLQRLDRDAQDAIAQTGARGVQARFVNSLGMSTRHPTLVGGERLPDPIRAQVAQAVAKVPGVGGIYWADGTARAESGAQTFEPLHCQDDVNGLLRTRSIRFQEASSALIPASQILLNEVAEALRPCMGAIIAITGHTDASGDEPANVALSMDRARAVREALVSRGIPRPALRARGLGSKSPVAGLVPTDPANRRIEFSVIRAEPLHPTPVDTPGAR